MNAFLALVRKDILQYLANRRAVLMSLVAPIVIAAFFGSLFGGGESKPTSIPLAVSDLDGSELSAKVVASMAADPALALQRLPEAEAAAGVRSGKLRAAITLPAGFGAQASRALFGAAKKPEIVLTVDPSQGMVLPLVRGLLAQHVMQPVSQAAFSASSPALADVRRDVQANSRMDDAQRSELLALFDSIARVQTRSAAAPASAASAGMPGMTMPFTTREVSAAATDSLGAGYNGYAHSFAGMGVQFILLLGVDFGIALLTLRRLGLWQRLRAAPLTKTQLLGSRIASAALIAGFVFAVILAVGVAVFGVRVHGSVLGVAAIVVAYGLVTASFGLMIAALGRTPDATRGLAILVTLLMVMLGGAWVPSFIFPPWLQAVSAWVPTHWAVDGLDAMTWRGLPLSAALAPTGVLLAFAAAFTAVALWRFRWED